MPAQPFLNPWRSRMAVFWIRLEALACVLLARLALQLFSFQQLTWYFNRRARSPERSGEVRLQARKAVRNALFYVYRRYLPQATCFHWSIAAQTMLRWRGVSTTLYYGAATRPGRGLLAHTWVQDGEVGVVGVLASQLDGIKVLARYPEA